MSKRNVGVMVLIGWRLLAHRGGVAQPSDCDDLLCGKSRFVGP
jgi:hypothetical protein